MLSLIKRSNAFFSRCSNQIHKTTTFQSLNICKQYYPQIKHINTCKVLCQKNHISELPKKKRLQIKSPITWKSLTITSIFAGALISYICYLKRQKDLFIEKERRREIGKAAIGGKFELIDSNGKLVKSDDFLGKWIMIYFGFTHCPDICPDELEKMAKVVDLLQTKHDMIVQPIFISVDPDRDSPQVVGKYIKEFSDKFIGLTGSREQVAKVCKAYRVYYSNGPKDKESDYIVDHTIIMYLIDPEGLFVDYYGQTHTADQIAYSIYLNKLKFNKLQQDDSSWFPSLSFKRDPQPL
ncbi:synthesis of cytochrome c oxidase [Nomia melanderi]|uniref:synthesis of cytochrome c oxidase n=1 Tax=Nomia melanderi TaxID=2448451 RepID=UPI0013046332|nr:protein SCO1 homolog, mitochondrial [Nomia melanderi]